METNPGRILQRHGIEVQPDDPRTTEEILAHMVTIGAVVLPQPVMPEQLVKNTPAAE